MGCWKPKANGRCSPMPIFPPPSAKSRSFGAHWLTSRLRPPWDRARWTGLWWAYTSPGCAKRWAAFSTQRCAWSRDFQRSKAKLLGDKEHFDVEAEAIQLLAGEHFTAGAALEQLEAALRILEWKSRDHRSEE